jgi:hypothetical protein
MLSGESWASVGSEKVGLPSPLSLQPPAAIRISDDHKAGSFAFLDGEPVGWVARSRQRPDHPRLLSKDPAVPWAGRPRTRTDRRASGPPVTCFVTRAGFPAPWDQVCAARACKVA